MLSVSPVPQEASSSIDDQFRQMGKQLVRDINTVGSRRVDRTKAPRRYRLFKTKITTLIGDPPKGHYDSHENRQAFCNEVDEALKNLGEYKEKLVQTWLEGVTNLITTHRQRVGELFPDKDSAGAANDVSDLNAEAKAWVDFEGYMSDLSTSIKHLQSPALDRFCQNMISYAKALSAVHTGSETGIPNSAHNSEHIAWEMFQRFGKLRTAEDIGDNKKAAYQFCRHVLSHMQSACPVPTEHMEFYASELGEFDVEDGDKWRDKWREKVVEEEAEVAEAPESKAVRKPKSAGRKFKPRPTSAKAKSKAAKPKAKPTQSIIERGTGNISIGELRKTVDDMVADIEVGSEERVGRLLRYTVHAYVDALKGIYDELIKNADESRLGKLLGNYQQSKRRKVFITSIGDSIVDKLGTAIADAYEDETNEELFDILCTEKNRFGNTRYDSVTIASLSAITHKKCSDLYGVLDKDERAREIIWEEVSEINAESFSEAEILEDPEGKPFSLEFILEEVERLVIHLEGGEYKRKARKKNKAAKVVAEKASEPESSPIVEVVEIPDPEVELAEGQTANELAPISTDSQYSEVLGMVQNLGPELDILESGRLEHIRKIEEIDARLEEIGAKLADIAAIRAARERLADLNQKQEGHKTSMPDFASEEFRAWSDAGSVLGTQSKELKAEIALMPTVGEQPEVLEKEKELLKNELAQRNTAIQEFEQAIQKCRDKLQQIKDICQ